MQTMQTMTHRLLHVASSASKRSTNNKQTSSDLWRQHFMIPWQLCSRWISGRPTCSFSSVSWPDRLDTSFMVDSSFSCRLLISFCSPSASLLTNDMARIRGNQSRLWSWKHNVWHRWGVWSPSEIPAFAPRALKPFALTKPSCIWPFFHSQLLFCILDYVLPFESLSEKVKIKSRQLGTFHVRITG